VPGARASLVVAAPSPIVRLGAVSYLNTRPLVEGLDARSDVALRFDVPARCADLVEAGEVDLGLVPIIEYARHADDYAIVPDVSIASRAAVDSVALFTRQPIERVRTIALDVSSRTSAGLVRLLCARLWRIQPAFLPAAPDIVAMLASADAALLIGDPALFLDPASVDAHKIDLGLAWRELTGLPFVWAVWAGRTGAASPEVCRLLLETRRRGEAAIEAIARRERPGDPVAQALVARYLGETIAYGLDDALQAGAQAYFDGLAAEGLIPRAARLRLFGSPAGAVDGPAAAAR
jgi:chorismate dehydratase